MWKYIYVTGEMDQSLKTLKSFIWTLATSIQSLGTNTQHISQRHVQQELSTVSYKSKKYVTALWVISGTIFKSLNESLMSCRVFDWDSQSYRVHFSIHHQCFGVVHVELMSRFYVSQERKSNCQFQSSMLWLGLAVNQAHRCIHQSNQCNNNHAL